MRKKNQYRPPKEKKPFSVRLLNFAIAAMVIIAVSCVSYCANEVHEYFSRERYGSISWYATEADYSAMITACTRAGYDVDPFPTENENVYQLGLYADAAFQHLYFETAGKDDQAAFYEARMDSARGKSGTLRPLTEDIDSILNRIELK